MSTTVRSVRLLLILVGATVAPAAGHAQSFTWNQPTSGQDWLTGSNWMGGAAPNATGTVAIFGNAMSGPGTVAWTGTVTVGELRFFDVNSQSASARYTLGTASQTIVLDNGASDALLTVSGITKTAQAIAAAINVTTSTTLTINNNGAPNISTLALTGNLSATSAALNISGGSNTTISGVIGAGFTTLTKSGPGLLTLSAATANLYTGGTVINGGIISVARDDQLGASGGAITLNGGGLQLTSNTFSSNRNITVNSGGGTILAPAASGTNTETLAGVISGTGSLTFDGGQYVALQGNNTYSGPTIINDAGIFLNSAFLGGTGRLANTSSITINGFVGARVGILDVQNGFLSDSNRVNDAAPITLNGGILSFLSGLSGNTTETVGNVTVRGFGSLWANTITAASGGTGTATLTVGTITRSDNFTTLYGGGPIGGPSSPGTTVQVLIDGFTDLGSPSQTSPVIPWIGGDIGSSGSATGHASTLFTYDGNGLQAMDPATSTYFVQVASGDPLNGFVPGDKNNSITGNPAALTADVTVLSLVQNPTSTASSSITGAFHLTVSSGAIANVNTLVFNGPTLTFGGNTAYFWLGNECVLTGTSSITGSAGVVVSSNSENGRNTLYLTNKTFPNNFTGGLYLNGSARVAFDASDSQLGAAGEVISFRGGTLRYTGTTSISLGATRPLQMTAAGGGAIGVESGAATLTVPGLVSGPEQLTKLGPGTLVLSNPSNTYQGGTTLAGGTLVLGGAGSLGTGSLTIFAAPVATAELRFNFSGTYAANINHGMPASFNTNGNNVTLSGVVTGIGATLTKTGAGALTLSAANTYAGNTVINGGSLLVTNSSGSGTGLGSVTVNTGTTFGGTGSVGGPVSVASGGTLVVGTPGGTGTLTHHGTTTLAGGSTLQGTFNGTTAGSGYSQLVVQSGGSIALGNANLNLGINYTPANGDMLFLVNNQNSGVTGLSGQFNGLAQNALYTFPNGTTARISYTGDVAGNSFTGGNDVVFSNFSPVPEPVTGLVVAAGFAGMVWVRRRR